MSTESFIIALFCLVDDRFRHLKKEPYALLHPSEIFTLGMLFALKIQGNRAFYCWLQRDWRHLFPILPERTRFFRLFNQYHHLTDEFLEDTGIFGVVDTFGIELLHPYREGRSSRQIGRKGLSNHRWISGVKLCVILNHLGLPVAWECREANVPDQAFQPIIAEFEGESIIFADQGFHAASGDPANLGICKRGERNQRMVIETFNSLITGVINLKRLWHRSWDALAAHIAYAMALFTLLVRWDDHPSDSSGSLPLLIARFRL